MTREEAIRRIKSWNLDSDDIEVLSVVIPELTESKDERIGNLIYCIVRDREDVRNTLESNGVSVDDALAYLEKQKEQKPVEWSEKDETRFNNLCCLIREAEGWNEVSKNAFIEWLKSLRPQPKPEWSEKDEKILDELLDHCNTENATWYNWLKSLRPQLRWKPSDEQIEFLQEAIEEAESERLYGLRDGLIDLMEALKKL